MRDRKKRLCTHLGIFDFVAVFDERYKEMLDGYEEDIKVIP